jgi:hypothetical protein
VALAEQARSEKKVGLFYPVIKEGAIHFLREEKGNYFEEEES